MAAGAGPPLIPFAHAGYRPLRTVYESDRTLVLRAERARDGATVVVKALKPDRATPDNLARYRNEYAVIRSLRSERAVRAHGLEVNDDCLALVLEDLRGRSLDRWLAEWGCVGSPAFSLAQFLRLAVEAASALADVHAAGLVHRDVCPANIVWDAERGALKLIDFALAAQVSGDALAVAVTDSWEGTLPYSSPEQTGRINRGMDQRTDLYSLGASLYELLSGRPPFRGDDPLALAHAHIARLPVPVSDLNPAVPAIVSDLVLKLLAKNPEDRYQSASALEADLARCLASCSASGDLDQVLMPTFALAQQDQLGRLKLSQTLHGRSSELRAVLAAIDRSAAGERGLLLVAGRAGVGKSALIAQARRQVVGRRLYFVRGKFDQYKRNTPYAGFTQALNSLADLLLTEPEPVLAGWREAVLAAVGSNAALLTEVAPNLERVIGRPAPLVPLSGEESRNRFQMTFRNFFRCASSEQRPLVVFLDDLQWADSASLDLLKGLLDDPAAKHVLVIGCYRDNEVVQGHPLLDALAALRAAGVDVRDIALGSLRPEDVHALVNECLNSPDGGCRALADLVHARSDGNALFTRQLLCTLYEDGQLRFDRHNRCWTWDLAEIQAQRITDDVVDLMTARIERLSPAATRWLSLAACIGTEFDVRTLALIGHAAESAMREGLAEAQREGLLVHLDDERARKQGPRAMRLAFLHDRVRQAAYARIPAPERQRLHLEIGDVLLDEAAGADFERRVFDIVQHHNQAAELITDPDRRRTLAEMNVRAAEVAYRAAAFQSAALYLDTALTLLSDDVWERRYDWALHCHSLLARCLSLTGDYERLEGIFAVVRRHARATADNASVVLAKIGSLYARARLAEAVELGLGFIQDMGVSINRAPSAEEAYACAQDTAAWLTEERIQGLPRMPDGPPELGSILQVAIELNAAVYGSSATLAMLFMSRMARLTVEQGFAPCTPVTLATFALLLCAPLHDVPKARLLAGASRRLLEERSGTAQFIPSLNTAIAGFVTHRHDHLRETLPLFEEAVREGLTAGAFKFVGECTWWHSWHHLFLGTPLPEVERIAQQAVATCQQVHMARTRDWCALVHQATLNLLGRSARPWQLDGDACREEALLSTALDCRDFAEVFRIQFYGAWLRYLFGRRREAVALFREAETFLPNAAGLYLAPNFHLYDALANAAAYPDLDAAEQRAALERIGAAAQALGVWARFAPMNHQHKKDLVEAEIARLAGRNWDAVTAYHKAIRGAKEQGFVHEEALAHELSARFWLEQHSEYGAKVHLQAALTLYRLWGAAPKVKLLEDEIEDWFGPSAFTSAPLATGLDAVDAARPLRAPQRATPESRVDVATLLKASQTLSETVQLNELLASMLRVILENAGAQRALVVQHEDSGWFVIGVGDVGAPEMQVARHTPVAETKDLSQGVFNYVIHSGKPLVLANAAEDARFESDSYLREQAVRSLLCLPIWHKGQLKLVLCMENNLASGVFTEDRIELLRLLSGRMAISLENALIYEKLESLVQRRTAELAEAKDRAEASNRAKSAFLANMSHELRTPLNGILGFAQVLLRRTDDPGLLEGLGVIQESGEHLLALINDLLDLAKAEAGRDRLEPRRVSLPALAAGVVNLVRSRAEAKGLALLCEVPESLPTEVLADEKKLRQVLLNLLGNAIKFTDAGRIVLRVEQVGPAVACDIGAEVCLGFTVRDTGLGLAPADLERIFQPFEQAGSGERWRDSTGLGLAISQQMVKLMGGCLTVESELGHGSAFSFEIRCPLAQEVPADEAPPRAVPAARVGPRRRILVADDSERDRQTLREMLVALGFDVTIAENGGQAVELAATAPPDAVLMDLTMPEKSGLEAIRDLRACSATRGLPIIVVSATALDSDREQSRLAGADGFLPKPVHLEPLAALLGQYLSWGRPATDAAAAEASASPASAELRMPPRSAIELLYDLAQRGNLFAIAKRAAELEASAPEYAAFARRVRTLARGFDDSGVLKLLREGLAMTSASGGAGRTS